MRRVARSKIHNLLVGGRQPVRITTLEQNEQPSSSEISTGLFLSALKACSALRDLETGKQIHSDAARSRHHANICVANALLNMYAKCGDLLQSRNLFNDMEVHDVVSWTTLILGCAESHENNEALRLFQGMQIEGVEPNSRTFAAALKACINLAENEAGKQINGKTVKLKALQLGMSLHANARSFKCESDLYVAGTLINLYAKCGSMLDAREIFDKIFLINDVVSWTALILGYAENGEPDLGLELFWCIQAKADARVFLAALISCAKLADQGDEAAKMVSLENGMKIHSEIMNHDCGKDLFVVNALVVMYAKCGELQQAKDAFDSVRNHDVVSWTALILGYAENGEGDSALKLFSAMKAQNCAANGRTFVAALVACVSLAEKEDRRRVESGAGGVKILSLEKGMWIHSLASQAGFDAEIFVCNTLVDLYAKCGSMLDSRAVFDRMFCRNLVSWTALMLGYVENGEDEAALKLFFSMSSSEGFLPDSQAYVAAIKACGSLGDLQTGRRIHHEICKRELIKDLVLENSLVDFYARCGSMAEAEIVFNAMDGRRSAVTWSALITGYGRQGEADRVLEMFCEMRADGFAANRVVFLSVLAACSHAGWIEAGLKFLEEMLPRFGVEPEAEHYHCVVDMLGRGNRLEDAVAMVAKMPFEATAVSWMTVLAGCCKWRNVSLGKFAFEKVTEIDAEHAAAHSLMANIYAATVQNVI